MATYGSIPGVKISTSTGTVSGVTIGRSQYLFIAGVGNQNATVDPAEPVQINSRTDVDEKFGSESDVATAYRNALANGANPEYISAVRVPKSTQSGESFTSNTGTLAETPVIPDTSLISAENSTGDALDVEFDWASPPASPSTDGVVYLNPYTGEFDSSVSETTFEYSTGDWDTALSSLTGELTEGEFGVINPLTAASSVGTTLQGYLEDMRSNMKMVVGVMGAEYNATLDSGRPELDATSFENTFSDDALFTVGPSAVAGDDVYADSSTNLTGAGFGVEALSAAAGLFAGNSTTEPVYDNTIQGTGSLAQDVTRADVTDLRFARVIPIRDTGVVRLEDNRSTYDQEEEGGWERDYFRRRIVDLTSVTLYLVARQQIGGILDGDTVSDVQDAIDVEMSDLVADGLLEPGQQDVNVYRKDDRTIGMDVVITPLGVAKGADINLEINA